MNPADRESRRGWELPWAEQRSSDVRQRSFQHRAIWTYRGLGLLLTGVVVVGTLGSLVGQEYPLVPVSSFGNVGEWFAGAAAIALIQAVRIDARDREAKESASQVLGLLEQPRSPQLWGQLIRPLQAIARHTECRELTDVAGSIQEGSITVRLPVSPDETRTAWDIVRPCLRDVVVALSLDETPPSEDLTLLRETVAHARRHRADGAAQQPDHHSPHHIGRHAEALRYLRSRQQPLVAMQEVHPTQRHEIMDTLDASLNTGEAEQLRTQVRSDCGAHAFVAFDQALLALTEARDAGLQFASDAKESYPSGAMADLDETIRQFNATSPSA